MGGCCGGGAAVKPEPSEEKEKFQESFGSSHGGDVSVPPEFLIHVEDVKIGQTLGAGAYGEVAIKKLKKFDGVGAEEMEAEILKEAYLLSRCHHPNVLRLYGLCHAGIDNFWLVTELAEHGSLMDAITDNDANMKTLDMVVQIAKDIVRGMKYLHGQKPPILHRDLKPQNILLDGSYKARIADFGLSRMYREDVSEINPENLSMKGTPWYLAPEITRGYEHIDQPEKVDVFSFGVILWQIYHRQRVPDVPTLGPDGAPRMPVKKTNKMSVMQILKRREKGGYYIPIDKKCPKKLGRLMKACWDVTPSVRPTFAEALNILEEIIPTHKHKNRSQLAQRKPRQTLGDQGKAAAGMQTLPQDIQASMAEVDRSKPQQLGPLYEIDNLRAAAEQPSTADVLKDLKKEGSGTGGVFGKAKSTSGVSTKSGEHTSLASPVEEG